MGHSLRAIRPLALIDPGPVQTGSDALARGRCELANFRASWPRAYRIATLCDSSRSLKSHEMPVLSFVEGAPRYETLATLSLS